MFVLSLIIFFCSCFRALSFSRSRPFFHFGFLFFSFSFGVHFSTFHFFPCICSSFDDVYSAMHASISLCVCMCYFFTLIFGLALLFPSFLPNFFTCVSSMSRNYILFSFKFLFRWFVLQWSGEWGAHEKSQQHFLSKSSKQRQQQQQQRTDGFKTKAREWKRTNRMILFIYYF